MISLLVKNNVIKIFNYIIYIYLTKVVKLDFPFPWPSRRAYLFLAEQGQGLHLAGKHLHFGFTIVEKN